MGMAASQARFLSLTARKTNVEYEGQQVNQQRTALANESANLYNQLNSVEVPTPPSTSDYYKTTYTFKSNKIDTNTTKTTTEYTLNNIYTQNGYTYARLDYTRYEWQNAVTSAYNGKITQSSTTTGSGDDAKTSTSYKVSLPNGIILDAIKYDYEPEQATFNIQVEDGKCKIGGAEYALNDSKDKISQGSYSYDVEVVDAEKGIYKVTVNVEEKVEEDEKQQVVNINGEDIPVTVDNNGNYSIDLSKVKYDSTILDDSADVLGTYKDEHGNACYSVAYFNDSFTSNGEKRNQPVLGYTLNNTMYFISASELAKGSFASSAYVAEKAIPAQIDLPCVYTLSDTGRYKSITVTDENGDTEEYDLDVANVQDESAYKQAMLDYEYEQAVYNKKIKDINAKTEAIQQQDRTLELRLKQLDTEQNALKTEMDAVSKVIEDNIEATFKTFA